MIREIEIANLGVIERTRLQFVPGFTVLTGETGAGKTLITTAVSQLLGAKSESGLVRHGSDEAVIDCVLSAPEQLHAQLDELGAVLDEDDLVVTRTIGATTRSRAIVGSRSVATATLADIVGATVTLHGQHGQTRLTKPAEQRAMLDAAGDLGKLLDVQRDAWQELRTARQDLADASTAQTAAATNLERLRQLVADVEAVAPTPNEDVEISERIEMLAKVDEIQRLCRIVHDALVGDGESDNPDVLQLLSQARKQLEHAAVPGPFAGWAERAIELRESASALAHEIAAYAAGLDADPSALDHLQGRKAAIAALTKRWNLDLTGVLEQYQDASKQLAFAADPEAQLAALEQRVVHCAAVQEKACAALHAARTKVAKTLAKDVQTELRELGLPHATFGITVTRAGEPTQFGDDVVEFEFSANPGLPPQPLAAVGSGGELSRVMLALEVAASDTRQRTFVFDEVDAGIGGKAALEVGKRLAQLARSQQVIVVTHLPQVAAFADQHIVVEKLVEGQRTRTTTRTLSASERSTEVARMLSGVEESASAAAHAKELLAIAADARRVAS